MRFFLLILWLFALSAQAQNAPATEEQVNQQYEAVKLELLCRSIQFILKENKAEQASEKLLCDNMEALERTIPKEYKQAVSIFNLFRPKHYSSFGKGKLEMRLDKFMKDLTTELTKLNRDRAWQEGLRELQGQLTEIRAQCLRQIREGTYKTQQNVSLDTIADKIAQPKPITTTPPTQPQTAQTEAKSTGIGYVVLFLVLLFLLTGGACAFLYWQIQELKKEIAQKDEQLKEQFNHLESKFPLFTPLKEYQSIPPKFAFLNDQINTLVQEIMILKTRNELKATAEEVYAKRTEHLEGIRYNPHTRMHYIKYRPDINGFNSAEFKDEPTRDSIFKLEISLENPQQATFAVVNRSEYHNVALLNADDMLAPACEYTNPPYNDSRIITHENGIAEKRGDVWVILKKATISFE